MADREKMYIYIQGMLAKFLPGTMQDINHVMTSKGLRKTITKITVN